MSNGILSGITAGLNNTYKYLQSQMPDGVTYDGIQELLSDSEKAGRINAGFASYIQSNFNKIDKSGDSIISEKELENVTQMMNTAGLTKEELIQMYTSGASGLSQDTMEMIMKYFDEIDVRKTGRITSADIAAFSVNSGKQEKMDEYAHQRATNMSTFWSDGSSGYDGAYSMLSYKYKNTKG